MSFKQGFGMFLVCKLLALLVMCGRAQIMSVDIGHEFFKVALMRQGVPLEIVLNSHSKRKTPTAVSFFEKIRSFGDDAVGHASKAPAKVPLFFHHLLAHNFTSADDIKQPDGAWWKAFGLSNSFYTYSLGYDAERGVPTFEFATDTPTFTEEVLANMFFFAKTMAEETAEGKPVRDLVVTLPSNANMRQRQAIVAAGEIAGCRVLTLVHETSAFAVQRAVDFQPEKGNVDIVMFYNLGSRKVEVSIVKFESKQAGMVAGKTAPVVTVLGSAIDFGVGGHLFDLVIAEKMLKKFQDKFPKLADGIVKNPRALRKLLATAQKTKVVLSANKQAPFIVESLYEDTDFQASVKRDEFEEMCASMFEALLPPIDKALAAANVTIADLTGIEVVGGAWRVPKIQALLSEYVDSKREKKLPLGQHLNGEEGAAQGSLLVGANQSSSFRVKKIFFTDITTHSYAVQVASAVAGVKNTTVLYPAGTALGAKKKLSFGLEEDFEIRLFEDDVLLSVYKITGLEDQLKEKWSTLNLTGVPKITVSVPLDGSGIIEVKDPKAVVEESYWVNVTVEKPKANASKTNQTEATDNESGESPEEKSSDTADDNASDNATENTTEVEVVQKRKTKKHEKKLVVTRVDFPPVPLTTEQIAASKTKLDEMAQVEADFAKAQALKNELEASVYGSRDKLEREDIIQVSTEEQREEVTKICTEFEDWMYEGSSEKSDYEQRINQLKDLLGPMEERAMELEARADLPDNVKEQVDSCKAAEKTIKKNMTWVNENKTAAAVKKLEDFEEWWTKKQDKQSALPLHEAPAYTKSEVMEKINKIYKEFASLLKTKKPKEKAPKKGKNGTATEMTGDKKTEDKEEKKEEETKEEEPLPADIEGTEAALTALRAEKAAAVEKEDYDAAHKLKAREKALNEHLAKLKSEKSEL